ncbi:hypothetical protein AMJ57_03225 [Parcubacteria bacterium SG8_24]|nr:MAG: hypothetical protein AMJ57_03225 [Parcubacteria bacterium SG8_24]
MDHQDDTGKSADQPFPLGERRIAFGRLSEGSRVNSVDDALADESAVGDAAKHQGYFVGLAIGRRRLNLLFVIMFVGLAAIMLSAARAQILRGDEYARLAETNRSRVERIPVERGVIYDRHGHLLVRNIPTLSVTVTPSLLPQDESVRRDMIGRLAEILMMKPTDIEIRLAEFGDLPTWPVTVSDDLDHDQAILIEIESSRMSGISLVRGTQREYLITPETPSLSHIIGYEGPISRQELEDARSDEYVPIDMVGKAGVERQYEAVLRGRFGKQHVEVDALGHDLSVVSAEEGERGRSLVLTIDGDLQENIEEVLRAELRSAGKARGSVVALDPRNGEILAMVSWPAYDNNLFSRGISQDDFSSLIGDPDNPLFHRSIASSLPSGSTFKLVVGAAALEEGVVTAQSTIFSTGGIQVNRWFFPDWKAGGHGRTDIRKAIAESVNTFFYVIGGGLDEREGLGVDRIIDYARRFGLGDRLGIDLPGEGTGLLPSREWKETTKGEPWYIGDTYHLAIGQGDILVTPVQIATMTSVFANGGRLIRPRVVSATVSSDGTRQEIGPQELDGQVVSAASLEIVRDGMRRAVYQGSAKSLSSLPFTVAAKTGTAQWSSNRQPHAWVTSFAPYQDPEIVLTVVVEEGGEGSGIATRVADGIYRRWAMLRDER